MEPIRGLVSVVVPVRNAGRYLAGFVKETSAVLTGLARDHEIILVDAASTDDTATVAGNLLAAFPTVRLVRLSHPYTTDVVLTAGLDTAIGDYLVLISPECDPPAEIPALLRKLVASKSGVVTGVDPSGRDRSVRRRAGAVAVLAVLPPAARPRFAVARHPVPGATRAAATAVARNREKHPQFPVLASQTGFAGEVHAYTRQPRPGADVPKRRLGAVDRAVSIVVLNSISPLRVASLLGVVGGLLNLLYAGYVVGIYAFKESVAPGWTTLSLQMSMMFLLVFVVMVVMCEYVGRTLEEAIDRPLYHVVEERNGLADAATQRRPKHPG